MARLSSANSAANQLYQASNIGQTNTLIPRGRVTYTLQETADLLGVSYKTVRRRVADGSLKAHKFGRLWLISASDLEALA